MKNLLKAIKSLFFKPSHKVTCSVCLIAKNEGPYLLEWVAYYKNLGFDEIIVYENNSTDNSAILLSKLHDAQIITHRPWPLGKLESPQITAYQDALRLATTDWMLFVDCDEFLVFKSTSLADMLNSIHQMPDVGAIGVNWRIFGSSHLTTRDDRPVIERFTMASPNGFIMNDHVKSFLRIGCVGDHVDMHLSDIDGNVVYADGQPLETISRGRSTVIRHNVAQINHYYTKTIEEFQIKKNRGQGGIGENSDLKYWYSDNTFLAHDTNDEQDLCAHQYLPDVKKTMERLKKILETN